MILGRTSPSVPQPVFDWLAEQKLGEPVSLERVSGGCINNGAVLVTATGVRFFLKTKPYCPEDMFAREADGLHGSGQCGRWSAHSRGLSQWPDFLLLEDLSPAPKFEPTGKILAARWLLCIISRLRSSALMMITTSAAPPSQIPGLPMATSSMPGTALPSRPSWLPNEDYSLVRNLPSPLTCLPAFPISSLPSRHQCCMETCGAATR